MAQFTYKKQEKPCAVCGKPTFVMSQKDMAFCSRICQSEYRLKARYQGMRSERMDRPKRPIGSL